MPHTDETFYKMAVAWTEDPKVLALARFGPVDAILARDLFSQMIGYSRRNLTDGWVPAEELGRLMYPLPVEDAERLAAHLADRGAYGPLCSRYAPSNGQAMPAAPLEDAHGMLPASSGDAPSIRGYQVLNYPKWNDTRADVQARTEHSRKAAMRRWDRPDAGSNGSASGGHKRAMPVDAEQEQERDTPLPPARQDAPGTGRGQGWTPSGVLDRQQPRRPSRGGAPTRQPPPAKTTLADAHRPGGPASDVHGWAAKARAGITSPDDPATGDRQEPLPEPAAQPAEQEPPEPDTAPEPEEPAEDEIPF
jgi:hypothetical protein